MSEDSPPRKSPYAVPYDRFAGDPMVEREIVVVQPHEPPHDQPSPAGDASGGDGD